MPKVTVIHKSDVHPTIRAEFETIRTSIFIPGTSTSARCQPSFKPTLLSRELSRRNAPGPAYDGRTIRVSESSSTSDTRLVAVEQGESDPGYVIVRRLRSRPSYDNPRRHPSGSLIFGINPYVQAHS